MAILDKNGLLQRLVDKIRSNGAGGLTRAKDVRDFIVDLIDTMYSLAGDSSGSSQVLAWDANVIYDTVTNPFAEYNLRIYKSKIDNNQGNTPPTFKDEFGNFENAYWVEVSPAPESGIVKWKAGIFGAGLKIVYHNKALYELAVPDAQRPFESTDITAEITAGKWIFLASVAAENLNFTTGDADNLGRWGAITLKVSAALNKLMDKFSNYYTKAETDGAIEVQAETADLTTGDADATGFWGGAIISINAAFLKLKEKILAIRQVPVGVAGQVVGFDANGNPIAQDASSGGGSGKIRHDTYTALVIASTMSWDVNGVAEGKAKITIPSATTVTDIAFNLTNAADGFTGILAVYNNDTVSHNINLPAAGIYAVSEGESASVSLAAGAITELNFAHDGLKIKVTRGAFVAI